jgi:hypothetical protein
MHSHIICLMCAWGISVYCFEHELKLYKYYTCMASPQCGYVGDSSDFQQTPSTHITTIMLFSSDSCVIVWLLWVNLLPHLTWIRSSSSVCEPLSVSDRHLYYMHHIYRAFFPCVCACGNDDSCVISEENIAHITSEGFLSILGTSMWNVFHVNRKSSCIYHMSRVCLHTWAR